MGLGLMSQWISAGKPPLPSHPHPHKHQNVIVSEFAAQKQACLLQNSLIFLYTAYIYYISNPLNRYYFMGAPSPFPKGFLFFH